MGILDGMPPDYGTAFNRYLKNAMYEISDRFDEMAAELAALKAKCAEGPATGAGHDNAHRPENAAAQAALNFPDWMTPHAATKAKLPEKVAIMGFIPSKEEVEQRISKLEPGVYYTKQQAAGIWNCSEKVAGCWFFYMGHVIKGLEYEKYIKSYKIPKE